ncbi:MAG: alkaline phosphatase family protein [Verrucomicrobia bacterium]|nr:alkaline phosphatase family protein [Verrucomicrobiota bacterium]
MRNCLLSVLLIVFGALLRVATGEAPRDRHVVVVVWDGMRPDFVSEHNTPTLWKLAQDGVTFRNHHSVYPSATIVNGTAIVTGDYPARNGILANRDYRPRIDAKKPIDSENADVVHKGDELWANKYIGVQTIAELLHQRGQKTAIATAKTVGLLFDRHADSVDDRDIFAGASLPPNAIESLVKTLGAFPPATQPSERDTWTTKALTDFLWHDEVPSFSLLWLSEPDDTEHKAAPGAPAALAAIKLSDENLGRVVAALDQHHAKSTTDIFVVSDHGFSTIAREIDVPKILKNAGFNAATVFADEPKPGQVMLVGNGGSVLFYVIGHDAAVIHKLVEFLQQTDFAGVIFTREPMEGTFTFDKAKIDNEHAADVVMSFRWTEDNNQFGIPGMIDADWQRAAGEGTHATLSKFDMHNMLIAGGPDFDTGLTSELPSGNVDLAPTILTILGIKPGESMDGRVLAEAMKNAANLNAKTQTIEATRKYPDGIWQQSLTSSHVGSTIYLENGNGGFKPKQ